MATDKFNPGKLVLVNFPGSGHWPCQVSRIISKNWRQVEYFGGGEEIGQAHIQVIRDYDEETKDDLEEFIPKKKMDKDPVLRQAVKEINQKLAGKKTKISGGRITTRSESKGRGDKKETGGKQKSQNTSEKKEVTAAVRDTRKTRQKKEFIGTKNDVKKTSGKGELTKKKIAEKKALIGARNKTKKIPGIKKIISMTKENDRKKENTKNLRAGVSEMRGSDGLINADNPECQQPRPNNEVPLVNNNTGSSQDINSHTLLNSDNVGVSVSTPMSHSTSVNNNHGVPDDVDIIIKCEIDENANGNSDTSATEVLSPSTTAEDAMVPGISAISENGGAFLTQDIPAQKATVSGSSASSDNSGPNTSEDISGQEATAPDTDNSSASSSTEGISANNLGDPGHDTEDIVRLNISMEMTPNTFSQISPALLTFVSQPNVTVNINVPQ